MGSYKIEWKGSAEKELRKLDPLHIRQIIQVVTSLEENPLPQGYRKLHGAQHQYRILQVTTVSFMSLIRRTRWSQFIMSAIEKMLIVDHSDLDP